ncbi:MAG: hypothetical protein RLZZ352_2160 [Pseudomonadota bacterium]
MAEQADTLHGTSDRTDLCPACLHRSTPPAVHSCVAAVDYAYPWDRLIARFKFRNEPAWAATMAEHWLHRPAAVALWHSANVVAPIPLTARGLGVRGYNQAWELVKAMRRHLQAHPQASHNPPDSPQCLPDALLRLGEVPQQHRLLTREARLHNLQGLFVAHPQHAQRLAGARVLLVDDVSTTGATLDCAAQALLQVGAHSVNALVFARTPNTVKPAV